MHPSKIDIDAINREIELRGLDKPGRNSDNKKRNSDDGESGWRGVGKDIKQGAKNVYPALLDMLRELPSEASGVLSQSGYRRAQNSLAGLGKGLHGATNIPGNIRDYLVEKQIAPENSPSFRIPGNPEEVDFGKFLGLEGQEKGDALIQGIMANLPYLAAGEAGVLGSGLRRGARGLSQAAYDVGQNENPVTGLLMPAAIEAPYRIGSSILGKGKKIASSIYEPTKEAFDLNLNKKYINKNIEDLQHKKIAAQNDVESSKIRAAEEYGSESERLGNNIADLKSLKNQFPKNEYDALNKRLQELEEEGIASKENVNKAKENAALKYGNKSEKLGENIKEINENIEEQIPRGEAKSISDLTKSISDAYKGPNGIKTLNSKKYEDFKASKNGQAKIKNALEYEDFGTKFTIDEKAISPTTADLLIDAMEPHANVNHYMTLFRQLRDEANKYAQTAKDRNVSYGDKQVAIKNAKELNKLKSAVEEKIAESLSSKAAKEFHGIQQEYKNLVAPMQNIPILKKATKHGGTVESNDFFSAINKKNQPVLMEYLISNPNVKEAIARHDFQKIDKTNVRQLKEFVEGDRGKSLPENIHEDIQSLINNFEHKELIDSLRGHINQSELNKIIKKPEINKMFEQIPGLSSEFKNVMKAEEKAKLLSDELKNTRTKQKKLEQHGLYDIDVNSLESLKKAQESAAHNHLPSKVQLDIKSLITDMEAKKAVDQLRGHINSTELNKIIHMPEITKIFQENPKLANRLDDISKENKRLSEIEAELKKQGLNKKQINEKLSEYNKLSQLTGSLLSLVFGPKAGKAFKASKIYKGKKSPNKNDYDEWLNIDVPLKNKRNKE